MPLTTAGDTIEREQLWRQVAFLTSRCRTFTLQQDGEVQEAADAADVLEEVAVGDASLFGITWTDAVVGGAGNQLPRPCNIVTSNASIRKILSIHYARHSRGHTVLQLLGSATGNDV